MEVRTIGRFCHEDDYLVHQQGLSGQHQAYKEQTINSLKHRLLVHLYRKAEASGEVTCNHTVYFLQVFGLGLPDWKRSLRVMSSGNVRGGGGGGHTSLENMLGKENRKTNIPTVRLGKEGTDKNDVLYQSAKSQPAHSNSVIKTIVHFILK